MDTLVSPSVRLLKPYVTHQQNEYRLKLDTNENPYPCSPDVQGILKSFAVNQLRHYPDADSKALSQALADYHKVFPEQIFVANGSDEVLALSCLAFFQQKKPLYLPAITYSCYTVFCQLFNICYEKIDLNERWEVPLETFPLENGGIILANPNAPTGHAHTLAALKSWLNTQVNSVVLIDEAYVDFGAQSALPLVKDHSNLLITRTFSKSRSLAGLRVGYAIASPELIAALKAVKDSYNYFDLNMITQACAHAALEDENYFQTCCKQIQNTREVFTNALRKRNFEVLPSLGNFVFAKPLNKSAIELQQQLAEQSIFVRHFNEPKVNAYLRISIGTEEEMEILIRALDNCY